MSGIESSDEYQKTIEEIALRIVDEHQKGKIPLFVIGSGISMDLEIPDELKGKVKKMGIPTMDKMIEKLYSLYNRNDKDRIPNVDKEDIERRFKKWNQQYKQSKKVDRSNVGGILGYFQKKEYLQEVWVEFINWLLNRCVNEEQKIGIIDALPSQAHEKIAELYEKVNAFCLTTNFDGLFYKALQSKYKEEEVNIFSYYTREDAERFFTTENIRKDKKGENKKDYAEIQIRGDIFFVECDPAWCDIYDRCPKRSTKPIRIWESKPKPLMCIDDRPQKPFISFPGTYEKDQEVREIIEVLWQYLAHKVSYVITIGIGGWWDPILTAFLSDLSRERGIPFKDVNISPEDSYIAKEIVRPDSSLNMSANQFMYILNQNIEKVQNPPEIQITYSSESDGEDKFWDNILNEWVISDFEKKLIRHDLVDITSKFAQLGLKSKWWGIPFNDRRHHNRLNHSKGVMKISTFLYENACKNSGHPKREEEKQFLRIAALLHDIGHLPFSHLIEEVFRELNWKPAGYIESFSHEYYTEKKVRKIFENDDDLRKELDDIGYSIDDLIKLINGEFGIGFLDAIINGPIDADKIDYVFRDAKLTNFGHQIDPQEFLDDMKESISISPEGLLVLKGSSAQAAYRILEQRERIYKDFYLSSHIRLLEKAVKFIIITYFVHTYNTIEITSKDIKETFLNDDKTQFSDLGAIRIAMASEDLEELSEKFKGESKENTDIEMKIVQYMKEKLDTEPIDERVKKAIGKCFSFIKGVDQKILCRQEDKTRRQELSISEISREQIKKVRRDVKTVTLRFPGAILIDLLPSFEFFKIAGTRKQKPRSDGTNVSSECILSPDLIQMVEKNKGRKRAQWQVRAYTIGEESEVKSALGLFERLLEEEERLEEVE